MSSGLYFSISVSPVSVITFHIDDIDHSFQALFANVMHILLRSWTTGQISPAQPVSNFTEAHVILY